jgi:hypothetical protein
MTRRRVIILGIFILLVVGSVLLIPTPRLVAWGWVNNEPFYQNRPVSWWRNELQNWEPAFQPLNLINNPFPEHFIPLSDDEEHVRCFHSNWTRSFHSYWTRKSSFLDEWVKKFIHVEEPTLALLSRDPAAIPVLAQLSKDENANVRWIVVTGLSNVGAEASFALLAEMVNDEDATVRRAAKQALAEEKWRRAISRELGMSESLR